MLGCVKRPQGSPPIASSQNTKPALKTPARDAAVGLTKRGGADALPPLIPFADGKQVRIRPLEHGIKTLEITVPSQFELRVEEGEEMPPRAYLTGPALKIVVGPPDGEFSPLADEIRMHMNNPRPPAFLRSEETEDGFLLVYRNWLASKHPLYNARVSRPKLKVECWATEIEKASDADLAAAICLTLRTAPDKSHN